MPRESKILPEMVFGDLTVIDRVGNYDKGILWECRCRCGIAVVVRSGNLLSGTKTRCGRKCQKAVAAGAGGERRRIAAWLRSAAAEETIRTGTIGLRVYEGTGALADAIEDGEHEKEPGAA